jgi:radical SAM-linked protein
VTRGSSDAPHPSAPVVQRLRVRWAKRGRLRFSSHRDFQRALERAIRRAGVPVAYSQGFSPHPRISYAGSVATGAASEAEYAEIAVTARCDPGLVRAALDRALPTGLDVVEVVEAATPGFAERLVASTWEVRLPGVEPAVTARAGATFLAADEVLVQRITKDGLRTFDARGAVIGLHVVGPADVEITGDEGPCAILRLVVRHGTPSVRPDDVLAGLRQVAALEPPVPPRVTRLAQGPLQGSGTVGDPLAPDREAAQAARDGTPADAAATDGPVDPATPADA